MGLWRDLRAYLDASESNGAFLDVGAALGALVAELRLDLAGGWATVDLNLPCALAESIGEIGESGSEAGAMPQHLGAGERNGLQDVVGDSKYGSGEGDGTRTRNHQIDSR